MDTVISLIPNDDHVDAARAELRTAGCAGDEIKLLVQAGDVWRALGGRRKARVILKNAALGAGIGLLIGALYGIPAGLYNCLLMDCPRQTSLIMWALVTCYWVAAGGLLGALVGLDRFEKEVYAYVEGVRRGEALLLVQARPEQAPQVMRILDREQGTLIQDLPPPAAPA